MTPEELLQKAAETVAGDRQDDYGSPAESFGRIARLWSALLGIEVEPWQVAQLMAALKLSRLSTTHDHVDSYVDLAGYAALGASLTVEEEPGQEKPRTPVGGTFDFIAFRCPKCGQEQGGKTLAGADWAHKRHTATCGVAADLAKAYVDRAEGRMNL